jgi:hypothetical protein
LPGVEERDNQQIKAVRATLNGKKKKKFLCAPSIWRRAKKKRDIFVLFFSVLSSGSFFPRRVRHLETMPHTHTHKRLFFFFLASRNIIISRLESIATAGRQNIPDRKHIAVRKEKKRLELQLDERKTLDMFKTLLL